MSVGVAQAVALIFPPGWTTAASGKFLCAKCAQWFELDRCYRVPRDQRYDAWWDKNLCALCRLAVLQEVANEELKRRREEEKEGA